jgi:DMSO/TMAO reductase YedYZ molybdopterin-dependent catalytic subunit
MNGNLSWLIRYVGTALLVVMLLLGLSGGFMLYGTWQPGVFALHRIAGWALIALLPWKSIVIYHSLKRGMQGRFSRVITTLVSLALAGLLLLVIVLALMWMWRLGPYQTLGLQTIIAWHWILSLIVFPLLGLHIWWRWPRPRRADFTTRRSLLRTATFGVISMTGWQLSLILARAQVSQERPRRTVTGSRGFGLFAGNAFPLTGESTIRVDADQWRLGIDGAVERPLALRYDDLIAMAAEQATYSLDCTSGWYTIQDWQGVPLLRLLEETGLKEGVAGVRLVSITGYHHSYTWEEAQNVLLATHVSGEVLAPRHGYPLRAVVPNRRGWFWVKWLNRIIVLDNAFQVAGGVLYAPCQVLHQWR